jgi:hypothetical protein
MLLCSLAACKGASTSTPDWLGQRLPEAGGTCTPLAATTDGPGFLLTLEEPSGTWRVEVRRDSQGHPTRVQANRQRSSGEWVTATYVVSEEALLVLEKREGNDLRRLSLVGEAARTSPWRPWVESLASAVGRRCPGSSNDFSTDSGTVR